MAGAGSAAIIAIGWQMGASAITAQGGGAAPATGSSSSATPTASGTTPVPPAGITGTFTGKDVYEQQFGGDVQVAVVFENGKITDIQTVACNATDGRDQACPMLRQEAIAAKSANISAIGGATYTSDVYIQSLQSALDAAGYKG